MIRIRSQLLACLILSVVAAGRGESQDEKLLKPVEAPQRVKTKAWAASWSPDNQHLVFSKPRGVGLVIMDLKTGQEKDIINGDPLSWDPDWSPTGEFIAFVSAERYNDYKREETWIIKPDGTGARRVAAGGYPKWSADGKKIFMHSRTAGKMLSISIKNLDVPPKVFLEKPLSWYPAVSPDETQVAFCKRNELVIINRESGQIVYSQRTGDRGGLPFWSPDGKYIVYGGFDNSKEGLHCLDVAKQKSVLLSKGPFTYMVWSKDGTQATFDYRGKPAFEIWRTSRQWVESRFEGKVPALIRGLDQRLLNEQEKQRMKEWIEKFGAPDARIRATAQKKVRDFGSRVIQLLKTYQESEDPEIRITVKTLIKQLEGPAE
jgi:dipeptidyl aminopeptidase/acylaminoacyl peptidase